mmetsp:Transcript_35913/g.76656  ORF Transcript_35913/g.76656 Transcript_35913/m.76656 type:complete len:397 (+) Transcript_35913:323-1513(+)
MKVLAPRLDEVSATRVPVGGERGDEEERGCSDERDVVEVLVEPVKLPRGRHAREEEVETVGEDQRGRLEHRRRGDDLSRPGDVVAMRDGAERVDRSERGRVGHKPLLLVGGGELGGVNERPARVEEPLVERKQLARARRQEDLLRRDARAGERDAHGGDGRREGVRLGHYMRRRRREGVELVLLPRVVDRTSHHERDNVVREGSVTVELGDREQVLVRRGAPVGVEQPVVAEQHAHRPAGVWVDSRVQHPTRDCVEQQHLDARRVLFLHHHREREQVTVDVLVQHVLVAFDAHRRSNGCSVGEGRRLHLRASGQLHAPAQLDGHAAGGGRESVAGNLGASDDVEVEGRRVLGEQGAGGHRLGVQLDLEVLVDDEQHAVRLGRREGQLRRVQHPALS